MPKSARTLAPKREHVYCECGRHWIQDAPGSRAFHYATDTARCFGILMENGGFECWCGVHNIPLDDHD